MRCSIPRSIGVSFSLFTLKATLSAFCEPSSNSLISIITLIILENLAAQLFPPSSNQGPKFHIFSKDFVRSLQERRLICKSPVVISALALFGDKIRIMDRKRNWITENVQDWLS